MFEVADLGAADVLAAAEANLRQRRPAPGVFLCRSGHGWVWLVTNTGTHPLGRGPTAHAIWDAAATNATINGPPPVIDLFDRRKVEVAFESLHGR